jgi:uncharacterized protein (DUF1499 family)
MNDAKKNGKWTGLLLYGGIALCVIGVILGQGVSSPFVAMLTITGGALLIIIAALIVTGSLIRNKGASKVTPQGWIALVAAILFLANTGRNMGGGAAPIHDISTDTVNPPEFVEIAKLRTASENPAEYLDDGTAELQSEAYPDIQTIVMETDKAAAFATAMSAAQDMGWEIVASNPDTGIIEAVASTPFVGFKDDVVIRVSESADGALVDVRSKSRIGRGDMGVNANRIRAYRAQLTGN